MARSVMGLVGAVSVTSNRLDGGLTKPVVDKRDRIDRGLSGFDYSQVSSVLRG
jgi:hypothetical protein